MVGIFEGIINGAIKTSWIRSEPSEPVPDL